MWRPRANVIICVVYVVLMVEFVAICCCYVSSDHGDNCVPLNLFVV